MNHITDHDIIAYLNGELSHEKSEKVAQHLHLCEECNQLTYFLQDLTNEWDSPSVQPQQSIAPMVMKEIEREQPKQGAPSKRKGIRYFHFCLAAAASILFSQLQVVEHILDTSNEVIGFSSQIANHTNQSLERGLQFLNNISNKLTLGDGNK